MSLSFWANPREPHLILNHCLRDESTPGSTERDRNEGQDRQKWGVAIHNYEVRPRKDKRGVNLIGEALPFGALWYN